MVELRMQCRICKILFPETKHAGSMYTCVLMALYHRQNKKRPPPPPPLPSPLSRTVSPSSEQLLYSYCYHYHYHSHNHYHHRHHQALHATSRTQHPSGFSTTTLHNTSQHFTGPSLKKDHTDSNRAIGSRTMVTQTAPRFITCIIHKSTHTHTCVITICCMLSLGKPLA